MVILAIWLLGIDDPRPFSYGFRACLFDKGILGQFLEKPDLEIPRFGVQNGLGSLRATNLKLFFKSKKFENFFFKKNSKSKISIFFKKKVFKLFTFEKKVQICGP